MPPTKSMRSSVRGSPMPSIGASRLSCRMATSSDSHRVVGGEAARASAVSRYQRPPRYMPKQRGALRPAVARPARTSKRSPDLVEERRPGRGRSGPAPPGCSPGSASGRGGRSPPGSSCRARRRCGPGSPCRRCARTRVAGRRPVVAVGHVELRDSGEGRHQSVPIRRVRHHPQRVPDAVRRDEVVGRGRGRSAAPPARRSPGRAW